MAKYWPNVQSKENFETEVRLANAVLPLPVDQRYDVDGLKQTVTIICATQK